MPTPKRGFPILKILIAYGFTVATGFTIVSLMPDASLTAHVAIVFVVGFLSGAFAVR